MQALAQAVLAVALGVAATAGGPQAPGGGQQAPTGQAALDPEEVITAQLEAFNAGDVEAMVANVAEDFVYFAVDAGGAAAELQGREAFFRSMQEYFASTPGARGEIEEMFPVGGYVAVRERAYWQQGGREVSQAALAVYEIRDGLIHRVWYYPAVP